MSHESLFYKRRFGIKTTDSDSRDSRLKPLWIMDSHRAVLTTPSRPPHQRTSLDEPEPTPLKALKTFPMPLAKKSDGKKIVVKLASAKTKVLVSSPGPGPGLAAAKANASSGSNSSTALHISGSGSRCVRNSVSDLVKPMAKPKLAKLDSLTLYEEVKLAEQSVTVVNNWHKPTRMQSNRARIHGWWW